MIHWTGASAGMRNKVVPWLFAVAVAMVRKDATASTAAPGTGDFAGSVTRTTTSRLGLSTMVTGCFVSVSSTEKSYA